MKTAVASMTARTAGRIPSWLSVRHSLSAEALVVLGLYGLYELARGLVEGNPAEAVGHAHEVATLERSLHVYVEGRVQDSAQSLPGLARLLSIAYLTLHLAGTAGTMLWLHQRRAAAFTFVRTTLLLASGLALVGFIAYPTAPPRLSELGINDAVSGSHINLNHGLVSSLYNPYAAVPSMHIGYALVVAASLLRYGSLRPVRVLAALYPLFVLLVVVSTGNHFFFDAAAGALVATVAAGIAALLQQAAATPRVTLPRPEPSLRLEELAA